MNPTSIFQLFGVYSRQGPGARAQWPREERGSAGQERVAGQGSQLPRKLLDIKPTGSRYLITKELGLEGHDCYGFWGLSP